MKRFLRLLCRLLHHPLRKKCLLIDRGLDISYAIFCRLCGRRVKDV